MSGAVRIRKERKKTQETGRKQKDEVREKKRRFKIA
jgi:hypothetical protein